MSTILVVDDERRYRDLLQMNLLRRGYRVLLAADGLSGLNLMEQESPDLVILDLMLPDMEGYEVCQRIREYSDVPIIMLTAKAEEGQKVRGLQLGADDYVTKPFGADEMLARVEAVLRRAKRAGHPMPLGQQIRIGELAIDPAQHGVTVAGQEVQLSPVEFKLLHHLALNAGRVLVQDELLRRVWGTAYEGDSELLHTAVRRLRQKIESDPAEPQRLLTKRGVGYWLANPQAATSIGR